MSLPGLDDALAAFLQALKWQCDAAVLLERQMVLFCPNIGMLSTAVLSLVPLVRPFAWQSLVLPILPALDKMLDLLEAPVPFILGVQASPLFFCLPSSQAPTEP